LNFPLYIDASLLKEWDCREYVRQRYLQNRDLRAPSVYYQYGIAVHKAVQSFWEGKPYEQAIADAYEITSQYPVQLIKHNVYQSNKWMEMVEQLPDLVACYYDAVEQDLSLVHKKPRLSNNAILDYYDTPRPMIETEWQLPYSDDVILCGRIDRVMAGPELPDVKTASEIANFGVPWKTGYQQNMMLQVQFGLYDWYLQQIGMAPRRVYLEVLLKGFKSKPCRYEVIELPYVTTEAYRERFRQQLKWKVSEIVDYFRNRTQEKPWPMTQSMCQTKYGSCPYLDVCLHGEQPKVMELYSIREEHLEIRK